MSHTPRIEVEPSGARYLVIGRARYFLGMTKAQADAKMKKIKAQKVRKNPRPKARAPKRTSVRRKPAKPRRNAAPKKRPKARAPKRNATQIYRLVYYTAGGRKVGTGEWNSDLSGIYGVAQRAMASQAGRNAGVHKAEIYYGARFVGAIDKEGRVWMSKAVGVR
jgi:hypothetical protein